MTLQPDTATTLPVMLPAFCQPLPRPFPTYTGMVGARVGPCVDAPPTRLPMPLPGHFYVPAPPAWSWPGWGSAIPGLNSHLSTAPRLCLPLVARGKTSSVGEPGAVAGAALPRPISVMQPDPLRPEEQLANPGASSDPFNSLVGRPPTQPPQQMTTFQPDKSMSSYNPALGRIFSLPRPVSPPTSAPASHAQSQPGFRPSASSASIPTLPPVPSTSGAASLPAPPPAHAAPPAVQAMMKDWQEAFLGTMQAIMQVMMGYAPPQPTAGPSVPQNTGPDALRQLSPSDGRETSWAPVQSQQMVAPDPGALQVMCQRQVETDGLANDNSATPAPLRPHAITTIQLAESRQH